VGRQRAAYLQLLKKGADVGSVDEKLRRGFDLAATANGDGDTLGLALLALHGALEDHLDETLRQLPELAPEDQQLLEEPGYGWPQRLSLALHYQLVSERQMQAIREVNRQRNTFAHGNRFVGSQRAVELYRDLVADLCGTRPTAAYPAAQPVYDAAGHAAPYAPPRRERASEGTTISASSAWGDRAALRRNRRPDLVPDALPVRALIGAAAVLVLLLAGWRLLGWGAPAEEPATAGAPLAPAITPAATVPPATPTPEIRAGRIVGLGGASGWMRSEPSFNAATEPPPLVEGSPVTLLDEPPVDAEGTTWVAVSTGGYEGWVPQNNVEETAPAPEAAPATAETPAVGAGP
jgi:hypothetical protein